MSIFNETTSAIKYCMAAQLRLLTQPWSINLTKHPLGREISTSSGSPYFCGLRVQMCVHVGEMQVMEDLMKRDSLTYLPSQETVDGALILCMAARGGEILISSQVHREALHHLVALGNPYITKGSIVKGPQLTLNTYSILPESLLNRFFQEDRLSKLSRGAFFLTSDPSPMFSALFHHMISLPIMRNQIHQLEISRMAMEDDPDLVDNYNAFTFAFRELCGLENYFLSKPEEDEDNGIPPEYGINNMSLIESQIQAIDNAEDEIKFSKLRLPRLTSILTKSPKDSPLNKDKDSLILKIHQHTRNYLSLLKNYIARSEDESKGVPMSEAEFISQWIALFREVEASDTFGRGMSPRNRKEKKRSDEFKEQLLTAFDKQKDENKFRDDPHKLYRSVIGLYGKFFIYLKTFMSNKSRQKSKYLATGRSFSVVRETISMSPRSSFYQDSEFSPNNLFNDIHISVQKENSNTSPRDDQSPSR
eukprot:NODE_2043_length_1707_cov_47.113005_g1746_i0.p1 GENE.NODE_2043_length_1707_cov_47.113005_g1746_i0~~NODE_2043_length_1707_cov_47.113005_g1746_i0.p1  ORF type:complete len:515 (-),score=95.56 NODE_2043_length_1707_cov_47.113005_g1746_i0:161-1588(-)